MGPSGSMAGPVVPPPTGDWPCSNTPSLLGGENLFSCGSAATCGTSGTGGAREWGSIIGTASAAGGGSSSAVVPGLDQASGVPWFWGGEGRREVLSRILAALLDSGQVFEVRFYNRGGWDGLLVFRCGFLRGI